MPSNLMSDAGTASDPPIFVVQRATTCCSCYVLDAA